MLYLLQHPLGLEPVLVPGAVMDGPQEKPGPDSSSQEEEVLGDEGGRRGVQFDEESLGAVPTGSPS